MKSGNTLVGLVLILFIIVVILAVTAATVAKIAWLIMTSKVVLVLAAIICGYLVLKKCFGR